MQQNNSKQAKFMFIANTYSSEYDAKIKEIELNVDVDNYKKGLWNQIRMNARNLECWVNLFS